MKMLGFFLLTAGTAIVLWSGYTWWQQGSAVTHQPEKVEEAHPEWENTKPQKTLKTNSEDTDSLHFQSGEKVGQLDIPRIGNEYEVFWGTGPEVLKQGVGLHDSKWTVTPNQTGHVVLSGHRDTVFRHLDQVENGDHLYVTFEGVTYDYQVNKTWITDKDDRSVIVKKEEPTLTLTTCYPFDFIGSAPKRYIIQAALVGKDVTAA
ncbi:class D sortase [Sediminibacillus halophilus]|uniref:Sortase A n=1 Tax=Sediminibacillus halophilus TaxID=482461 RepID=A0A1G9TQK6_9BACI|nr:class D sortase [Sediminibacillus halophilus]SDM49963.1 sortase A [Sediminibacillus halophilus]